MAKKPLRPRNEAYGQQRAQGALRQRVVRDRTKHDKGRRAAEKAKLRKETDE